MKKQLINKVYMKRTLVSIVLMAAAVIGSSAQERVSVDVKSNKVSGTIDENLYGQLFEHIYFSANNGVWQELIFERSFEPEHYPGITPRDGFFDGWYMQDDVLHSPTRYEQPLKITSLETDSYDITMDINWRAYKLARRSWSGGMFDIRFAIANDLEGNPYYFRIHDPKYEAQRFTPAQTESQIQANNLAQAREKAAAVETGANFAISQMVENEVAMFGRTRKVNVFQPLAMKNATESQIDPVQWVSGDWHKLRISVRGKNITAYWDGKKVVSYAKAQLAKQNDITFWVNYTEAYYKNIKVASADGKKVYFQGTPEDVKVPSVAPQWTAWGNGEFELVKGDAINMDYSQKVKATSLSGLAQGPQNVIPGEKYIGSIYAKGDGKLSVGLRNGSAMVASQSLGVPGKDWKKFDIELTSQYKGDADFVIAVEGGTVQFDQVTLTTQTGLDLGGFRPDILKTVKDLHPTCLRWPGGGYVAQYDWKWGIGPQEERRRWDHWMWMDYDQNCFGTDEFIKFCREINSEPIIVVPVGFERPDSERGNFLQSACEWLRYCNAPATDEWGAKRAANGHPEPYNVKFWEIDNEMWEMGIERYEACVREFSTAMREIDPSITIIACGGFQEDEQFIQRSGNYFDFLSLHHYEQAGGYATGPKRLAENYDKYAGWVANSPNPNIKLFISEWNLNTTDWRTGLFAGGFLNMCEARDIVGMGAAALFIRRTDSPDWNNAFINFDYKDLFVAPNFQVTELWYNHFSKYLVDFTGDTKELSVVTTMSQNGRDIIVKVVNPTETAYTLEVGGDWKDIASADYEYYAPGSLTAANTMENKNAVALKHAAPSVSSGKATITIDPLSAGVITLEKKF